MSPGHLPVDHDGAGPLVARPRTTTRTRVLGAAPARRRGDRSGCSARWRRAVSAVDSATTGSQLEHEHEGSGSGVLDAARRRPTTGSRCAYAGGEPPP